MLQRAASNAYSWWWASHIRTKQSKWLEQNLQDMDEQVEYVLKLIQEDGDSFAKRAEMYYKNRPEVIHFVEESYRAFRALAQRYDSLSTELQNANTTIATCFPEQVQFSMDDEDDYDSPSLRKNFPQNFPPQGGPAPKVPKVPNRALKGILTHASKKLQAKKKPTYTRSQPKKSGLTKNEALEEIDKLQKDILALQTVKEFVKSSYETGRSKYVGIENEIREKQEKVSKLQDEFSIGTVIDDDDARTLMAEAALKTCQETLAQLQDKQEKSTEEAKVENKRIEDSRRRLKSLKHEILPDDQTDDEIPDENFDPGILQSLNEEVVGPEGQKLEVIRDKMKEQFEGGSQVSITVTELAEKIDNLVNKVISLESSVSSQTVLIDRLRTEADDLQSQIRSLENDKVTLVDGTLNLSNRVKEMEEKLKGVQNLNKNVATQNSNLQTHFTEAHCSLGQLSEKLQSVKPDEESEEDGGSVREVGSVIEGQSEEASAGKNKGEGGDSVVRSDISRIEEISAVQNQKEGKESQCKSEISQVEKQQDKAEKNKDLSQTTEKKLNVEPQKAEREKEKVKEKDKRKEKEKDKNKEKEKEKEKEKDKDEEKVNEKEKEKKEKERVKDILKEKEKGEFEEELNWQQMLLSGEEDKEKILMTEYNTILRNYKEIKKKLTNEERKNDALFETALQVRDLKTSVAKRDQEIQALRNKLDQLQAKSGDPPEATESAEDIYALPTEEEEEEIKFLIGQPQTISLVEDKLRGKIDAILDENLDFWLRFSTAFHQIQKFKTEVQDLQAEISQFKGKEVKKGEGKSNTSMFTTSEIKSDLKSDVRAVYKHLSEINTELTVWLEQSESLKDELQRRFLSLCSIQEDITAALKEGVEEEEITFSSHQAAKFQGEVLNMKQENNKVNEELLAGIDHVTTLQTESEKTLAKLDEDYGLKEKPTLRSNSRARIPLRSFIFGIKEKKKKQSILSYMHHNKKLSF